MVSVNYKAKNKASAPLPRKKQKKWALFLGKAIALIFGIGCGINSTAALFLLLSGVGFYVLAPILFICTSYANYRMCHRDASDILSNVKTLFKTDDGKSLSKKRKAFFAGGIVLSFAFAATIGFLTWGSTAGLVGVFTFLSAISVAIPPVGIFFGAVTFVCLFMLMVKAFNNLVKTQNFREKITNTLHALFGRHPTRDKDKSKHRFILERVLVGIVFTLIALGSLALVFWGQTNTLKACAINANAILLQLTHASAAAINIAVIIVAQACAFVAQIPFTISTTLKPILLLFARGEKTDSEPHSAQNGMGVLFFACIFHGAASGVIALHGAALEAKSILGGIGACLNSLFGAYGNNVQSNFVNVKKSQPSTTAAITAKTATENTKTLSLDPPAPEEIKEASPLRSTTPLFAPQKNDSAQAQPSTINEAQKPTSNFSMICSLKNCTPTQRA